MEDPTAAVQGFGNVGSVTAKYLYQQGIKVTAVSDLHGAIRNPAGLDIPRLLNYVRETGSVSGFEGSEAIDGQQVLEEPVDVLAPCAVASVIHERNADRIQARLIVEGANGPVTYEADQILNAKGKLVIPGILANAGGVVVSYFEWVQDIQHLFWSEEQVNEKLYYLMGRGFEEVYHLHKARDVDTRTAAMMLGVGRVAAAKTLRGLYP